MLEKSRMAGSFTLLHTTSKGTSMPTTSRFRLRSLLTAAVAGLLVSTIPTAMAADAQPADHVVINEAYVNGGSAGASYLNKFVELYNPTDQSVSLDGWSLQYRSYSGTSPFGGIVNLTGAIAAGGHYLIQGNANSTNGETLPVPDATTGASWSGNANGGTLVLSNSTSAMTGTGDLAGATGVVDLLGYRASNTFEAAATQVQATVAQSMGRTGYADTQNNAADFGLATPTPCNTDGCATEPDPDPDPEPPSDVTIADIQGEGDTSPLDGDAVRTRGVVTATYPTGGFNGAYIQTEGTGGTIESDQHLASHGVFVYSNAFATDVQVGDFVEVAGTVSEYQGLTELSTAVDGWQRLDEAHEEVKASTVAYPGSEAGREALEGMLVAPQGSYTITDNYATNQYAEIGLAADTKPLMQPTNVARPGSLEYQDLVAYNAARSVTLDDGASINFLGNAANKATPMPWLTPTNEVRVGASVEFTENVVLDYRNNTWKLQPTAQLTSTNADEVQPATFTATRADAPEDVGGGVMLATFNVLNYFTTTGADAGCSGFYDDREGNPITVRSCGDTGPRGAANDENLERQQAKIVTAINAIDADVVSLEEIENSAAFNQDRDTALSALVDALNLRAGSDVWNFVPSPASVPANEDVIRTAFIYKTADVETVGASQILVGNAAFDNARQPLAQAFKPVGTAGDETFVVVVNHFKSKGSGSGDDADQGDGQAASNASRVRQAHALVEFADAFKSTAGTEKVFLAGDFNSYTKEDPLVVLEDAGYVNVAQTKTDEETYQFDGMIGSLDHVFASAEAFESVKGADIWNINAYESIAREYSRFNYNVTNFYDESAFRSSDHDPILVGFGEVKAVSQIAASQARPTTVKVGRTKAKIHVEVATSGLTPAGSVTIYYEGEPVGEGSLKKGATTIKLSRFTTIGPKDLSIIFHGTEDIHSAMTTVTIQVVP